MLHTTRRAFLCYCFHVSKESVLVVTDSVQRDGQEYEAVHGIIKIGRHGLGPDDHQAKIF